MRKVVISGFGSLLLSGLLVTQSWAGSFSSDLACSFAIKKARVTITAKGDVKGDIALATPAGGSALLACAIQCSGVTAAGPVPCAEAEAGDTKLKIKAPGLGTALGEACIQPAVIVGGAGSSCTSVYTPPSP